MEDIYQFNMAQILAFALVFLRMTGFVVAAPVIGVANVPVSIKVLLALTLSFILMPQITSKSIAADLESLGIVTLAVKELFVGLTFGFLARMFFLAVSMAGQIISVSLGLSAAQLFNPSVGETSSAFDQFFGILAILFFFAVQGHHILIKGLFETYSMVPIQQIGLSFSGLRDVAPLVQTTTAIALKMSAPLLVSILFMNIAIALVGKAVPQINILITSLPINVMMGLAVLFIALPLMIWQMKDVLELTSTSLFQIIKSF